MSVRRLVEALESYAGALLVVSHDEHFLADLHLDRTIMLDDRLRPLPSCRG